MNPPKQSSFVRTLSSVAIFVAALLTGSNAFSQDYIQHQQSFQPHQQQHAAQVPVGQEYFQHLHSGATTPTAQAFAVSQSGHGLGQQNASLPAKQYCGIDQFSKSVNGREPTWKNTNLIPFERTRTVYRVILRKIEDL